MYASQITCNCVKWDIKLHSIIHCSMCRYLQERIRQVEDERSHALSTIAKYKVLLTFTGTFVSIVVSIYLLCKIIFLGTFQSTWSTILIGFNGHYSLTTGLNQVCDDRVELDPEPLVSAVFLAFYVCQFLLVFQ